MSLSHKEQYTYMQEQSETKNEDGEYDEYPDVEENEPSYYSDEFDTPGGWFD